MSFWESSALGDIAGIVIGAVITIFFFLIGQNRKSIEYQVISANLVTTEMTNIPGISIMLDGEPVKDLVSTTITFVNSGNQTIVPSDFATLEPLGISSEGEFLSIEQGITLSSYNPNSAPHLNAISKKYIQIGFDFLKPKQTITITFLHNGALTIMGELKSGKRMKPTSQTIERIDTYILVISFLCLISISAVAYILKCSPVDIMDWELNGISGASLLVLLLHSFNCVCILLIFRFLFQKAKRKLQRYIGKHIHFS